MLRELFDQMGMIAFRMGLSDVDVCSEEAEMDLFINALQVARDLDAPVHILQDMFSMMESYYGVDTSKDANFVSIMQMAFKGVNWFAIQRRQAEVESDPVRYTDLISVN